MNQDEIKTILLGYPATELCFPFDETTAVFKVKNKMFALYGINNDPLTMNLKCDPEDAQLLRSQFPAIQPGYHMNKEHWNTVTVDGSLSDDLIRKLIDDSFHLVVSKLPKRVQKELRGS